MSSILTMIILACGSSTNVSAQDCKLDLLNCRESLKNVAVAPFSRRELFLNRCVMPKLMRDVKRPL